MTELEEIMERSGAKINSCSCSTCVNMCHRTPCLGTPADIARLINEGYIHMLIGTLWVAGLEFGIPEIPMIQIEAKEKHGGTCPFLKSGLCSIHTIKPIDGKLSSCTESGDPKKHPVFLVAKAWLDPKNWSTVEFVFNSYIRYEKINKNIS